MFRNDLYASFCCILIASKEILCDNKLAFWILFERRDSEWNFNRQYQHLLYNYVIDFYKMTLKWKIIVMRILLCSALFKKMEYCDLIYGFYHSLSFDLIEQPRYNNLIHCDSYRNQIHFDHEGSSMNLWICVNTSLPWCLPYVAVLFAGDTKLNTLFWHQIYFAENHEIEAACNSSGTGKIIIFYSL